MSEPLVYDDEDDAYVAITRSPGNSPVILAFPHVGTDLSPVVEEDLNNEGLKRRDTDWHVDRLYAGLLPDATKVATRIHRYVIDVNRDPSGASLYPGQNTTGLIPLTDFDNQSIWQQGKEPGEARTSEMLELFHKPYHKVLGEEIDRVKAIHGIAVLFDCHSIRSVCPFLFEGTLPDFNIGTNDGLSCAHRLEQAVLESCSTAEGYTHVLNGRFKGGWTTRHYGRPDAGVHAIQMELAQITHLVSESPPFTFDYDKARRLRLVLAEILHRLEDIAYSMSKKDQL